MRSAAIDLIVLAICVNVCVAIHPHIYRTFNSFRKCLAKGQPLLCVKEASLQIVNETLVNDKPMMFYDMIEISRNPNYNITNAIDERLPTDLTARSVKIDELLHEKVEDYFKSRTIKFIMAPAVEGDEEEFTNRSLKPLPSRTGKHDWDEDGYEDYGNEGSRGGGDCCRKKGGGGGGGKKGGMMMMGMVGMACMMGQMMMGKVAFMAGTALIIAKVALFMTAMMSMKKGGGGGGGTEAHVVYAAPAEHSHGGGGWHRSMGSGGGGGGSSYAAPYPESSGGGY